METCSEYVEDEDKVAKNEHGQVIRTKLKINLSYNPGVNPMGCNFKSI
jgi:hypothetical protein